ncbi:MAG: LamG-like jellyroll fold domain-containing protein [Pseudorhodobacter sp.]
MLGLDLALVPTPRADSDGEIAPPAPPADTVSAIIFGQSELEYLLNTGIYYRSISQPIPGDGNLILFTQSGEGSAPVRTEVNLDTVSAGQVNPAMAALSAFLDFAAPGQQFVIGDGAVSGTSRFGLGDDSADDGDNRIWLDFTSVVDAVEDEAGSVGHLIECWYNADAASVKNGNFRSHFWPLYFGTDGTGAAFTLGGTVNGSDVNHCLWDATATVTAKGRGVFARDETSWHILGPMPFLDAPEAPEMAGFSANNARMIEPSRANMVALESDDLAQSVDLRVGPSSHICRFGGSSSEIHPDVANPDGQILLMWPIAMALLRASGMEINEPQVVGIEGPEDGAHADLLVSLPNGGTLTTLRAFREGTYAGSAPHRQPVTGVEITRDTLRRPVYLETETSYPAQFRGAVTIQSASETHGIHGRVGRVRIIPETPFASGDTLSYLRGQATAVLQEPRDFDLYPDFLIEHIPALHDETATYPFEGIAVRPFQQDIHVPVSTVAFTPRSAGFDGSSGYAGLLGSSAIAGTQGMFSIWLRSRDTAWNASAGQRILQARGTGGAIGLDLYTAGNGRLVLRLYNDSASDTLVFYAGSTSAERFEVNEWYHLMVGWDTTGASIWVNGTQLRTQSFNSVDMAGGPIMQLGIGMQVTGSSDWIGDLGHLWFSVTQTPDLSDPANRAKFAQGGAPVDLGPNGQIPTGTAPEWYFDGDGSGWTNQGTAGTPPLEGTLMAGEAPGY